jgi:hypothetical protein
MRTKTSSHIRGVAAVVYAAALGCVVPVLSAAAPVQSLKAWHETMRRTAPPMVGCFRASYPSVTWLWEACQTTNYRSRPPEGLVRHQQPGGGGPQTVGDGDDYAAGTSSLTDSATGSFAVVSGLTSETGSSTPGYSLQLNTDISSSSPACASYGYSSCKVWQQFIYSSDYTGGSAQAFIQNWLFIPTGAGCPAGWTSYSTTSYNGCYENSGAVNVPSVPATQLASLKLSGSVVKDGADTVTFADGTTAYAVSEYDTTLDISDVWNESEFNVVGNGGGSQAQFNFGTWIAVELQVNDGSASAPTCLASAGTTGETNNLSLGSCSASGGAGPYIEFTESYGVGTPRLSARIVGRYPGYTAYEMEWTSVPGATYTNLWYRNGKQGQLQNGGEIAGNSFEAVVYPGQFVYYAVQACDASACGSLSNTVTLFYSP